MRSGFVTVRTEGGLLPVDALQRVASADRSLPGMSLDAYHLPPNARFNELISAAWNRLLGHWTVFRHQLASLRPDDPATTLTRERWLLPLFSELGYGRLPAARSLEIDGKPYPLSHAYGESVPVHLVGAGVDLDRRSAGVAGAARMSPHGLLQEYLNRSDDALWGFVSNGLRLRLLRDSARLTRQAFVEFDLEAMLEGEAYADFSLLWLLCHQSRLEPRTPSPAGDDDSAPAPAERARPDLCWLEMWSRDAAQRGVRALDTLQGGVRQAISALGAGFLAHPANGRLRDDLRTGTLDTQEYYRQLLRTVYRLLFLCVAEDRDLLLTPEADMLARERYARWYSTARLRALADRRSGTRHHDLWQSLRLVFGWLGDAGKPELGLPALGGGLWDPTFTAALNASELANRDLLDAVRALAFTVSERVRHAVDFRNLGAEELGSVYESLLELHPVLNLDARTFELATAGGNERKMTGSYYTPTSLIAELLDSALEPVIDDRLANARDAEAALLGLKVVDPACGSGHFLVAAAHRIARRLAQVRTGDDEPSPDAVRAALREVIGRCLYGVDINPMSVELCKVSLWMEAMEPGKPLSFLDHHIRVGNSLLGATPALLAKGIPDEAFTALTGDDKKVVSDWKKRNKQERSGQRSFDQQLRPPWEQLGNLAAGMLALDALADDSAEAVRRKQELWEAVVRSSDYLNATLLADAWCAAFVWKRVKDGLRPITENVFRDIERSPYTLDVHVRDEVRRLAGQYRFFHWHLAFPDVFRLPAHGQQPESDHTGWLGGFDVVLGNPPWERIKLQEKEFFAQRRPEIAAASNTAARRRMIERLQTDEPRLYGEFQEALRQAEGESHLIRTSGRYPLTGRGDVNTYALFAETNRTIVSPTGRVGCIVPTGIATDATTQYFFRDLMETATLASLYDFENRKGIFPAVDSRTKFCLLTLTGPDRPLARGAEFVFFALATEDLRDDWRRFILTSSDLALLNPNTRTCPIFRSQRDAELTKAIYRRVPVLIKEGPPEENPWGITFSTMFHMSNDSHLFRTRAELESRGGRLEGNVFTMPDGERYLPLYEAKMIHQFDHRWATYDGTATRDLAVDEKRDPLCRVMPRYWVDSTDLETRIGSGWNRKWLVGYRDITNSTNERTAVAAAIPLAAVGHTCPLIIPATKPRRAALLLGNLGSFLFDYVTRQKVGGTHLTYGLLNQLPVLTPDWYDEPASWSPNLVCAEWLLPRVLELTYTAWDLEAFGRDCGYAGPPFRWDEARRFLLRCELDAAFFHLYGIAREDVDYIMETFPIVKRKDIAAHGEYRTKRVILEIYDEMAEAARTGVPYQTRLDPPPADPRVTHPEV